MPMLIPLAATVVGEGIKAYGANKAAKGGLAATEAGLMQQAADRKKAMADVSGVTTAEANLNPAARTEQARLDFLNGIRSGNPQVASSYASVPGANARYADAVKTASDNATAQSVARGNLIAGIRGLTRSREDVRQKFLDAGTDVSGINQDANRDANTAGLNVQQASQINPAYGLVGQFLQNMGGAYKYGGNQPPPRIDTANAGMGVNGVNPWGQSAAGQTNLGSLFA